MYSIMLFCFGGGTKDRGKHDGGAAGSGYCGFPLGSPVFPTNMQVGRLAMPGVLSFLFY